MPAQPQSSGLVDLYRLFVFRGAVGVGAPLFQDLTDTINLELLEARPLPLGRGRRPLPTADGRRVARAHARATIVIPAAMVPSVRMSARRPPRWMSPLRVPGWVSRSR